MPRRTVRQRSSTFSGAQRPASMKIGRTPKKPARAGRAGRRKSVSLGKARKRTGSQSDIMLPKQKSFSQRIGELRLEKGLDTLTESEEKLAKEKTENVLQEMTEQDVLDYFTSNKKRREIHEQLKTRGELSFFRGETISEEKMENYFFVAISKQAKTRFATSSKKMMEILGTYETLNLGESFKNIESTKGTGVKEFLDAFKEIDPRAVDFKKLRVKMRHGDQYKIRNKTQAAAMFNAVAGAMEKLAEGGGINKEIKNPKQLENLKQFREAHKLLDYLGKKHEPWVGVMVKGFNKNIEEKLPFKYSEISKVIKEAEFIEFKGLFEEAGKEMREAGLSRLTMTALEKLKVLKTSTGLGCPLNKKELKFASKYIMFATGNMKLNKSITSFLENKEILKYKSYVDALNELIENYRPDVSSDMKKKILAKCKKLYGQKNPDEVEFKKLLKMYEEKLEQVKLKGVTESDRKMMERLRTYSYKTKGIEAFKGAHDKMNGVLEKSKINEYRAYVYALKEILKFYKDKRYKMDVDPTMKEKIIALAKKHYNEPKPGKAVCKKLLKIYEEKLEKVPLEQRPNKKDRLTLKEYATLNQFLSGLETLNEMCGIELHNVMQSNKDSKKLLDKMEVNKNNHRVLEEMLEREKSEYVSAVKSTVTEQERILKGKQHKSTEEWFRNRIQLFVTEYSHSSMHLVGKEGEKVESHVYDRYRTDKLEFADFVVSKLGRMKPSKLLGKSKKKVEFYKKLIDANYMETVDKDFDELSRSFHKQSAIEAYQGKGFAGIVENPKKRQMRAGKSSLKPRGQKKAHKNRVGNLLRMHQKMYLKKRVGAQSICSEFVVKTEVACLFELNLKLNERLLDLAEKDPSILNLYNEAFGAKVTLEELKEIIGEQERLKEMPYEDVKKELKRGKVKMPLPIINLKDFEKIRFSRVTPESLINKQLKPIYEKIPKPKTVRMVMQETY